MFSATQFEALLSGELVFRNADGSAGWVMTCEECKRKFNLRSQKETDEWHNGHDCET